MSATAVSTTWTKTTGLVGSVMAALAALVIALTGAPMAEADPLTVNDLEFIEATDRVIVMHTGSDPDGHWVGYPRVPAQLRIDTAHAVCQKLDNNAGEIDKFIIAALDDRREHAGYLAGWFKREAVEHYCPEYTDQFGEY